MLARRPFPDRETLSTTVESAWWTLEPNDWLEAFLAHPRIGEGRPDDKNVSQKETDQKLSNWSSQEQSGVHFVSAHVRQQLAEGNHEYEQRFGWIFLVNATGKTAHEMLALLHARLNNSSEKELRVAAGEQAKITILRLNKLLDA